MENNEIVKPWNPLLPKGTKILNSEFVIDKFLDRGGMGGDVYLCHTPEMPGKKLVCKLVSKKTLGMDEEAWKRLYDEGRTALRASGQPNLVYTYNVLKSLPNDPEPKMYFIMDYVEGVSLRKYLASHGTLSVKSALTIFLKICYGIKSLHNFAHQIIHRDLKPENIMISPDLSTVTIIDFGISTVVDTTNKSLNPQGKILRDDFKLHGTLDYIIPDVYNQYDPKKDPTKRKITAQADFFSLGIILYEMIMGQKPFNTKGINEESKIIMLPTKFDIPNISANPTIPVSLENLIFKCTASKPNDVKYRYNKIEEIIADVKKIIPLINKDDKTELLKPVETRMYQHGRILVVDNVKSSQKWYKQWWVFAVVMIFSLGLLIACIVMFFIIE